MALAALSPVPARPAETLRPVEVAGGGTAPTPWVDRVLTTSQGRVSIRETSGDGLPVLLLHGNSSCKEAFRAQMGGALGARHRMVAIDFLGHGASEDAAEPDHSYTLLGYADLVVEVAETLGLDRYALLGWSLGGHVALEACASAPGIVGVLTVGAPPIGSDPSTMADAFRRGPFLQLGAQAELSEAEVAALVAVMGVDGHGDLVDAIRRADGRARSRVMADALAGGASDERAVVEAMRVPLAVIDGADDAIVDGHYVDALSYGSLWEGRRHVIPRAGHAPFLTAPDLFNALLGRFLHDLDRKNPVSSLGLSLGG
ncbi:alpha/beta fold hydrolase [Lichenibacterium dinghuense]|uniref:alpha/beta fold hydrolase n=1 Tax=Lichenibacterium dinghuense TaxID=2895977 RepID=UPI001F439D30|nr:alpha/beta fold hydrolase [Lichenibacterium sp. 6Y81]